MKTGWFQRNIIFFWWGTHKENTQQTRFRWWRQGLGLALLNTHKFSNAGIVFKINTKLNLQLADFLKYKRFHSESKHIPTVEILPNLLLLQIKANLIRT